MAFDARAERGLDYRLGMLALLLVAASLATALAYQYIGGYPPCELCYLQRYAYYASLPLLFLALVLSAGRSGGWAAAIFFIVALAFLANAGLGVYHAGAEWKFWPGPSTCSGDQGVATSAGSLLQDLQNTKIVRCDEPSLRVLGLSFAGWNVVTSLILMALTLRAAFAASERSRAAW